METTYRTNRRFRIVCGALAAFFTLTIIMIPFAIGAWWLGFRSSLVVRDDSLEINWFGRRTVAWDDIAGLGWVRLFGPGGMLTRYLMNPMEYSLREGAPDKKRATPRIAVGVFERSDEIIGVLKDRTGLQIVAA